MTSFHQHRNKHVSIAIPKSHEYPYNVILSCVRPPDVHTSRTAAIQGHGGPAHHVYRAGRQPQAKGAPSRPPTRRPTATSAQHPCTPTAGGSSADMMLPRRRQGDLAAALSVAAPPGPAAHALQTWQRVHTMHGHNRSVRSGGLSTAVQQPTAERGRAFDGGSRAHLDELKPVLLHHTGPGQYTERGLREWCRLRRTHAHMPSVRAAQSRGTAARGGR